MRALIALLLPAVLLGPAAASAQDACLSPDLLEVLPPDGATLPTDAVLRGRYAATARYDGEWVIVERPGLGEEEVEVAFDDAEGVLIVTPLRGWTPVADYVVQWPALFGVGGASIGVGGVTAFRAGAGPDTSSPAPGVIGGLTWDVDKPHDDCSDAATERYFFRLYVGDAADDAGVDLLEAVIFQTLGPNLPEGAPPRPVWTGALPEGGGPIAFGLPREESLGRVCFSASLRDLSGRVSPASPEACTETRRPPFWEGCAAGAGSRAGGPSACAVLALLLLVARRRRAA